MNITSEFKKLWKNQLPDKSMFVPLLKWSSGYKLNILACQRINHKFYKGEVSLLIMELTLNNKLKHFIKYPETSKDDEKTRFYYNDVAKYYGWSRRELSLNNKVIDLNNLKEIIAQKFGYNNKERKLIKLKPIKIKGKNVN